MPSRSRDRGRGTSYPRLGSDRAVSALAAGGVVRRSLARRAEGYDSLLRPSGDDAGGQGVGIAPRRFIDRVRNDPLDGRGFDFRHTALLAPLGLTASHIPPLPTAGWPPLVKRLICGR